MQTTNIISGTRLDNRELAAVLGHVINPSEWKDEDTPPFPGSIEFHYRNHPNLLRVTRLRANRHGNRTDSSLGRQLGVN